MREIVLETEGLDHVLRAALGADGIERWRTASDQFPTRILAGETIPGVGGRSQVARDAPGKAAVVPPERILAAILLIRDQKVMLDASLADLYGVETRALVQAVKRNGDRFPSDFMFQLSRAEFDDLRSQNVMSSSWGGRRSPPYAFTEQGVAMLSSVLRSRRAVQVNVEIMRAFVRLRELIAEQSDLARRLDEIERRYDDQFREVFEAIRALISEEATPKRIGFHAR